MAKNHGESTGRPIHVLRDTRTWLLASMYVVVLATSAGFSSPPSGDALEYRQIASAAPGLPTTSIGSAYTGRFASHYAVGILAKLPGVSLDTAYALAWALAMAALFAVVLVLFRRLPVPEFALCSALFVLNPYTLRPFVLQTDSLQDLVFVVGLGICLLGLRQQAPVKALGGLLTAVLGRQTAVGVAPVAALWILVDPAWRKPQRAHARPWTTAAATLVLPFVVYGGIKSWTARFSVDYEPSLLRDSVLTRIGDLPAAAPELAAHLARTAIPLTLPVAVLVPLVVIAGWRNLSVACWMSLLMAGALAAQPAMIDPAWVGFESNEQRLGALAVLPLVYAISEILGSLSDRPHRKLAVGFSVAVIAVASLHHEFTSFGPRSLEQFLSLQLVAAVVVAGLITFDRRAVRESTVTQEV